MSHLSRIKTKLVEKEYLIQAIHDLGYETVEDDQKLRGMFESTNVEIKIPLRVSNDIGFRKHNGAYEIIADWWGVRGVERTQFVEKLNQRYAYHAARAQLEKQGFSLVEEEEKESGQIRLVLRRAG